ncbi:MAG: enoyl-CoA hydratase-related protein, partial [Actinomycetota bacterium]
MSKLIVERGGRIIVLTLNRPDVHNAIDSETAEAIALAIKDFEGDPEAKVLVVTGAGAKSFSSG